MNTQTFAQDQDFTAINDDELIAVNGGWAGALAKGIGKFAKGTFKVGRDSLALDAAVTMADGAING